MLNINVFIKKIGFTLAEVLITLGIVGIVAQMTIPTLMSNIQNQQYVTGLKKAYSNFNQVLTQIAADNNCVGDLKCTGLFSPSTTDTTLGDQISKYFKVVKNCGIYSDTGITGCFPDTVYANYDTTSPNTGWDSWWYRFIAVDGTIYMMHNNSSNCSDLGISNHVTNNLTQVCGMLLIDVNGLKPPNAAGRDIYQFYITNGKGPLLYPLYGSDDSSGWGPWRTSDGVIHHCYSAIPFGLGCAARIMDEGWQMKY